LQYSLEYCIFFEHQKHKQMKSFNDVYVESATTATFTIGFSNVAGKLVVSSPYTDDRGGIRSFGSFAYDGGTATLTIGDIVVGKPGKIVLGKSGSTTQSMVLDAATSTITVGDRNSGPGKIKLRNTVGNETISMDAGTATLTVGGASTTSGTTEENNDGEIHIKNKGGEQSIKLDGKNANLWMGATGSDGDIHLLNSSAVETVNISGGSASLILGASGTDGDIHLKNASAVETVLISGSTANITLGGGGADGDLILKNNAGNNTVALTGNSGLLTLGGIGTNGDITIKNLNDIETIKIIGSSGDIEFLNADFAEEFDIATEELEMAIPGTVMILNANGMLIPSEHEYDGKVAGIITGAGHYKPGIVMDKKGGENRRAVAMMGKVFCYADATDQAIEVGDILTTSGKKGYAMKAANREKAFGATIGKALGSLPSGTGLIPVLVTLQ
jgi:hypothetical protein